MDGVWSWSASEAEIGDTVLARFLEGFGEAEGNPGLEGVGGEGVVLGGVGEEEILQMCTRGPTARFFAELGDAEVSQKGGEAC